MEFSKAHKSIRYHKVPVAYDKWRLMSSTNQEVTHMKLGEAQLLAPEAFFTDGKMSYDFNVVVTSRIAKLLLLPWDFPPASRAGRSRGG